MKILIIECTVEELKANRTIMENVNDVLNGFTSTLFGIDNIDFSEALGEVSEEEEG